VVGLTVLAALPPGENPPVAPTGRLRGYQSQSAHLYREEYLGPARSGATLWWSSSP